MDTAPLLIYHAQLHTPSGVLQPGWLLTEGKTIRLIEAGEPPDLEAGRVARQIDARGRALLPGFIDLHVHGAMGHDTMDASPDGLREMSRFYALHSMAYIRW